MSEVHAEGQVDSVDYESRKVTIKVERGMEHVDIGASIRLASIIGPVDPQRPGQPDEEDRLPNFYSPAPGVVLRWNETEALLVLPVAEDHKEEVVEGIQESSSVRVWLPARPSQIARWFQVFT